MILEITGVVNALPGSTLVHTTKIVDNDLGTHVQDVDLHSHWDLGDIVTSDPANNEGTIVYEALDLGIRGNGAAIGRPTGPVPITPDAGETSETFQDKGNLVGALTVHDRFDFREGSRIFGTIDGRLGEDSIDYRDVTTDVQVNLTAGTATNVFGGLVPGTGGPTDGSSIEHAFGGNGTDVIIGDADDNILGDGHGSDRLDGGPGNDILRVEPGASEDGSGDSLDVLNDINGHDTVDFRFADSNVIIDMDLLDTPMDVFPNVPGDQIVALARLPEHVPISPSMFENAVGSQYNDIFYFDPLPVGGDSPENGPPVIRNVDGNDPFVGGPDDGVAPDPGEPLIPGDTLYFDAQGNHVFDAGYSITAAGLSTVTYQSIETLIPTNQKPRIIDNGDATFLESPHTAVSNISPFLHWNPSATDGFGDDYLWHYEQETGPNSTIWTFEGVQPGRYRVAVTWPSAPAHPLIQTIATDAPFTVFDDDFKLATVDINQTIAPDDFRDAGVVWEQLGFFDVTSHSLVVELNADANGQVMADAVRIERITAGPEISLHQADTALADGVSTINMTTSIGKPTSKTFVITNDGDAPLEIYDIDLPLPGEVSPTVSAPGLTLSLPAGPPSFASPVTLPPGGSYSFSVVLNAAIDPFADDPFRDGFGGFPAELRIFTNDIDETYPTMIGAGVNPSPDNDPLTEFDPFTVQVRGEVERHTIVDNGDAGFTLVGGDWLGTNSDGYQGDSRSTPGDGDGDRAIWTFTNLPSGTYRVSANYPADPSDTSSTAAPYVVSNQSGPLGTVTIDQSQTPLELGGFVAQGAGWVDLNGPYLLSGCSPTSGCTLTVELNDSAGDPATIVHADAVRIERLFEDKADISFSTDLPDMVVDVGGVNVADEGGLIDFGSAWPAAPVTKTLTIRNDGGADLVVREPLSIPAGFTLVDFAQPPGTSPLIPTGEREFVLAPGEAMSMRLRLDTGYPGFLTGEVSIPTGTTADPPLHADPDETPFNFRVQGTMKAWSLIDNQHASGFAHTGFALSSASALASDQGFNRAVHYEDAAHPSTNPVETADWTFTGLTEGASYLVSATWSPYPNRATNAPYTITGVTGGPTTVTISQRRTPDDLAANGTQFEHLGVFTVTGGNSLNVTLSNQANGQVIADAVRIQQVVDPEIVVNGGGLVDRQGTIDFGTATVDPGTTRDQSFTIGNSGSRPLTVGIPIFPVGFQLIGDDLPAEIPPGESRTITVGLDRSVAGAYRGTLIIPNDELDENPFEIILDGDIVAVPAGLHDGIINNEDGAPAFTQSGFLTYGGQGRLGTVAGSVGPTSADTATFSFAGLAPGLYRVSTTWTAYHLRATDAPYRIYDGSAAGDLLSTVTVNQRVAPGDFTVQGSDWEDLDIIRISGSQLTVVLAEGSDGDVVADAVRIERLTGQPEIQVEASSGLPIADGGSFDFGSVLPAETREETFTLHNLGETALTLGTLRLPAHFELTTAPDTIVAPGGSTSFSVEFQPPRIDTFSGELRLSNDDSNENPFHFSLIGDVTRPSFIVDNDNPGYSESGPLIDWNNQGFADPSDGIFDVDEAVPGGVAQSATWTFTLDPDTTYRVAATWTAAATRGSDAPYTIDGDVAGPPITIDVDQRVAPDDFSADGGTWENLTIVRTESGATPRTLTVTLTDVANGPVVADAIRIEALPDHGPEILVTGPPYVADAGSFDFGTSRVGTQRSQTFTVYNMGTSGLTLDNASLAASVAAIPGYSLVSGFTPAATAAAPLAPGDSATFVVSLDAASTGTFGGTISFDTNDADESPFDFTISGTVNPDITIVDNTPNTSPWPANPAGTAFTTSGAMNLWAQGFQNDIYESAAGGVVESATYSFPVEPGGVYQVAGTWTAYGNRATDAPYFISGVTNPATVRVNQRLAPNDFQDGGGSWEELGIFTASSSTITVQLSGSSTGSVIIDAVRIERLTDPEIDVLAGTTQVVSGTSTFNYGSRFAGSTGPAVNQTFTVSNIGVADLILQPITVSGDFSLNTATHPNFTSGQVLAPGASVEFEVALDAASAGSKTGNVSFGNNDSNESPFSFNLAADVANSLIIDDGDPAPAYSDTGNMPTWVQGFQNDVREATSDSPEHAATYVFSGLPPGTYRVSATWTPYTNRATNAPYTVNGTLIPVNQQLPPNNPAATGLGTFVSASGATFADLTVTASPQGAAGTITVDLTHAGANGNVIIDAIRIERLSALHAASPLPVMRPGDDGGAIRPLTTEQVDIHLAAAVDYWTGVDADAAGKLSDVQVIVRPLPPSILGLGSLTTPTIWLDDDAARLGWSFGALHQPATGEPQGIDLLTVVTHELGHVLGRPDLDPGLHPHEIMAGSLAVGQRRGPGLPRAAQFAATDLSLAGYRGVVDQVFGRDPRRAFWLDEPIRIRRETLGGLGLADRHEPLQVGVGGQPFAMRSSDATRRYQRTAPRFDRESDESRDAYFAGLGEPLADQRDAQDLLDE